ncbi:hypothetical protein KHA96_22070 [Bacillus sp. FJAT-49711]|uniref:hypothetical protein n=1 Tax=Bacillus sp. FJAT-49711 TaxID=2833585 RepID=UPI001BC9FCF6|nr:hypothetical protein [Bacillus sp. FJAT-49711]MBS4220984.1 hypothetical protein [Bacillus sp. FJAT-49711]
MNREIRLSEKILLLGLFFVFLFMLLHDWVPLDPFNDVHAVSAETSIGRLIITSLINTGQMLVIMVILLSYMGKKYPIWAQLWLIIHQSCIFIGAMLSWWIPYFFGIGAADKVGRYTKMFGNTHSFLPVRNGIVPNTIHTIFHLTLFLCIALTIYLSFIMQKKSIIKKGKDTVRVDNKFT